MQSGYGQPQRSHSSYREDCSTCPAPRDVSRSDAHKHPCPQGSSKTQSVKPAFTRSSTAFRPCETGSQTTQNDAARPSGLALMSASDGFARFERPFPRYAPEIAAGLRPALFRAPARAPGSAEFGNYYRTTSDQSANAVRSDTSRRIQTNVVRARRRMRRLTRRPATRGALPIR